MFSHRQERDGLQAKRGIGVPVQFDKPIHDTVAEALAEPQRKSRQRTPIQIAAVGVENTNVTQCNSILFSLCDDGTIWEIRDNTGTPRWYPLPSIPQDSDACEGADF